MLQVIFATMYITCKLSLQFCKCRFPVYASLRHGLRLEEKRIGSQAPQIERSTAI